MCREPCRRVDCAGAGLPRRLVQPWRWTLHAPMLLILARPTGHAAPPFPLWILKLTSAVLPNDVERLAGECRPDERGRHPPYPVRLVDLLHVKRTELLGALSKRVET